jgi:hypothetical protein
MQEYSSDICSDSSSGSSHGNSNGYSSIKFSTDVMSVSNTNTGSALHMDI